MIHPMPLVPALLCLAAAAPQEGAEVAWTRFRGPEATGVLAERAYPASWGPDENVAWTVDVDGSGWSSPVVLGERLYLTAAIDPAGAGPVGMASGVRDPSTMGRGGKPEGALTFQLTCRNLADGELVWSTDVGSRVPAYGVHRSNTFATETPATDGERLFVTFGALGELVAYDLAGEELWRAETGVFSTGNNFGWGTSVVAGQGLVFLQNDNEEDSFLAAFDAETGERAWRMERPEGSSWGTPILMGTESSASLVAAGPDTVIAYEPTTGDVLWRVQGIGGSFSSSITYDDERVYFGNSGPMSRGPLVAVPRDASGLLDLKAEEPAPIAWKVGRAGPGFASPIAHDGLIYIVASTNILTCHEAATGKQVYKERLADLDTVVACPWIAGEELHVLDEAGTTVVVRAGREFEILRTNRLPGLYWGTPSVAGKSLLLREASQLHCIRE